MAFELLTEDEATNLIRVSQDTVCRLAAKGDLPAKTIGRTWQFPKYELEEFLRQRSALAGHVHSKNR